MWPWTKDSDEKCCLEFMFLYMLNKKIKNQHKKDGFRVTVGWNL
jgi:hypothetical protein